MRRAQHVTRVKACPECGQACRLTSTGALARHKVRPWVVTTRPGPATAEEHAQVEAAVKQWAVDHQPVNTPLIRIERVKPMGDLWCIAAGRYPSASP